MPVKPCAMIKGTRWQKYAAYLIWKYIFYVPAYRCRHHNSPGPGILGDIAMFWVDIPGHIIMLVLGTGDLS